MRHAVGSAVLSFAVCCFPAVLSADVTVTTSLNLTSLSIGTTAVGDSVQLSGVCGSAFTSLCASAYAQVFDSLGGSDTGSDFFDYPTASASAATTLANASGSADATALTASSSSGVNIPGGLIASAGTVPGSPYGDLGLLQTGILEIIDPNNLGNNPVTVNFSAMLNGNQSLMTDADGVLATSEVIFNLVLCCTGSNTTSTTELFYDNPLQIGPSSTLVNPISTTLTGSDTLLTNTPYSFEAQVDAESFGNNVPEPSSVWMLGTVCACAFWLTRFRRRRQVPAKS